MTDEILNQQMQQNVRDKIKSYCRRQKATGLVDPFTGGFWASGGMNGDEEGRMG